MYQRRVYLFWLLGFSIVYEQGGRCVQLYVFVQDEWNDISAAQSHLYHFTENAHFIPRWCELQNSKVLGIPKILIRSNSYNILKKLATKRLNDPKSIKLIIEMIFEVDTECICYLELVFREWTEWSHNNWYLIGPTQLLSANSRKLCRYVLPLRRNKLQ